MGVFRLFRGELKKIFLRPGIFIMTGLLILVLTIAPKLFTPINKNENVGFKGDTVTERFDDFEANFKESFDDSLITQKDLFDDILNIIGTETNFKREIATLYDNNNDYKSDPTNKSLAGQVWQFRQLVILTEMEEPFASQAQLNSIINEIIAAATKLQKTFMSYTSDTAVPVIFVTEEAYEEVTGYLQKLLTMLESQYSSILLNQTWANYYNLNEMLKNNLYVWTNINTSLNSIKNAPINEENLEYLIEDYYDKSVTKSQAVLANINKFIVEKGASFKDSDLNEIDKMMYKYIALQYNTTKILQYGLLANISSNISDAELSSYVGFKDFNRYQINEELTRYQYLFNEGKSEFDFANVFAFNRGSNPNTNAYDYMYFTLEILSFVIIAYGVVLAAGMIAQEQSTGTIKLLAIRPYKREKIMFAKILAAMFFVTIFVVTAAIVSFITGYIIYGVSSMPILAIFNAGTAFTISAPLMIGIYLLSMLIKTWIFVLLAFAISTLFKSYVGATVVSIIIYFLTMIVTFVAAGANWLKWIIFSNLDFFKYFGGSFLVSYEQGETLTNLFISPVFADTNIIYTAVIVGALALILHITTFTVFKKRDII